MPYPPENIEELDQPSRLLAQAFRMHQVDLSETRRFADLLKAWNHQLDKAEAYLKRMANNPPARSTRTQQQYQGLLKCWELVKRQNLPKEAVTWVFGQALWIAKAEEAGIR